MNKIKIQEHQVERKFNLEDYETVEERLIKFWDKYPNGRVDTMLIDTENNQYIFMAHLYRDSDLDTLPFSTGYAQEVIGQGMVNKTSALENCETSAIGRALANGGFATKGKRASREEMAKVQAAQPAEAKKAPAKPLTERQAKDKAATAIALAQDAADKDALRIVWNTFEDVLDVEGMGGLTVRAYIMQKSGELQ